MLEINSKEILHNENKARLELYALLGEGYKAMQEHRESDIKDIEKRLADRRKNNE